MNIGTPEQKFSCIMRGWEQKHYYQQTTNDKVFLEVGELWVPSNQYPPEYLCIPSKYYQKNQGYYLDVSEDKP